MTLDERDRRIHQMTEYQKAVVLREIHDVLFRVDRPDDPTLDPEKQWNSDTASAVAAAFGGTHIGYLELGGTVTGPTDPPPAPVTTPPALPTIPGVEAVSLAAPVPVDLHAVKKMVNEMVHPQVQDPLYHQTLREWGARWLGSLIPLVEGLREMMFLDINDQGDQVWQSNKHVDGRGLIDWVREELHRRGLISPDGPAR